MPVRPRTAGSLDALGLTLGRWGDLREPQIDDERCAEGYSDLDACVAYLAAGGHLLYVEDHAAEPRTEVVYGRFYVVAKREGDKQ